MNYRDYLEIKGLPYIYTQRADFKINLVSYCNSKS